jgi:hypothetical protein
VDVAICSDIILLLAGEVAMPMTHRSTWAWFALGLIFIAAWFFGLGCHALNPGLGLIVGLGGLAVLIFTIAKAKVSRTWIVFLTAGLVFATLFYFSSAFFWMLNSAPGAGNGFGQG